MEQNHSTAFPPRVNLQSSWLAIGWLALGLACVCIDDWLQPHLTALGGRKIVRDVAELWQDLGSTPGILGFLLVGAVAAFRDAGRTAVRFVATIFVSGMTAQTMKYLLGRARPDWVHDTTHFYGPFGILNPGAAMPIDSMPSGHTTVAFAMAVALAERWPKGRVVWFLVAAGVGIARTFVDRHFPSDVIIGALVGTFVGVVVCRIFSSHSTPHAANANSLYPKTTALPGESDATQSA